MPIAIAIALSIAAGSGVAATTPNSSLTLVNPPRETLSAERVLKPQSVRIELSSTGSVVSATAAADVPPSIGPILETAARSWQFSPREREGVAIGSWVNALVSLTAVPVQNQYRLRVTQVIVADYAMDNMISPVYPAEAARAARGATVCMQVQVINGVQSIEGLWVDGSPAANGDLFARSARKAMQSWRVKSVDPAGSPYDGTIMIPIRFTANRTMKGAESEDSDAVGLREDPCKALMPERVRRARLLSKPEGALL